MLVGANRYKHRKTKISIEYLEKEGRGRSERPVRSRCENLQEGNKYWLEMEKRIRVLCRVEEGTLNHPVKECVATPRESIRVEDFVPGKINLKVEEWKRRRKEKHQECRVEEHELQMHERYITIYL